MFDGCLRFYLTTSGLSFLCFRVTYVLYLNTANASEIVIDEPVTLKVLWCQGTEACKSKLQK